ncbi:MAG: hypothetical protein JO230_20495 [Xanthobacteraceae bacterium]|nr:hypothetical protein [Xanthobacteraceae bacterium]
MKISPSKVATRNPIAKYMIGSIILVLQLVEHDPEKGCPALDAGALMRRATVVQIRLAHGCATVS